MAGIIFAKEINRIISSFIVCKKISIIHVWRGVIPIFRKRGRISQVFMFLKIIKINDKTLISWIKKYFNLFSVFLIIVNIVMDNIVINSHISKMLE
jgi:hypothetical protein